VFAACASVALVAVLSRGRDRDHAAGAPDTAISTSPVAAAPSGTDARSADVSLAPTAFVDSPIAPVEARDQATKAPAPERKPAATSAGARPKAAKARSCKVVAWADASGIKHYRESCE
jgi:hypothetical protein